MRKIVRIGGGVLLAGAAWAYFRPPAVTEVSVAIGHSFEQVARNSSFPVASSSNLPSESKYGFGATWVTKPAVIIRFDDPKYGFTLPATTFAAIGYMDNKVDDITTSPMLTKLPFKQAFSELTRLQHIFQTKGWRLENNSAWFDVSADGATRLRAHLKSEGGRWISIGVPSKYSMYFGLHCASDCDSGIGLDRYLIDISIGKDHDTDD
ncbi:hypothetical protein [Duganella callida]|uniref:Uncharacterized protein n=1 Tax=Duganella callida TaxID=2561932 RepID=A0A4Y9RV26_9BURK|nr:hypothetical protein [Duganella callida]TFW11636.1 hypothetical protein E4L98_29465 [Duganella callida]